MTIQSRVVAALLAPALAAGCRWDSPTHACAEFCEMQDIRAGCTRKTSEPDEIGANTIIGAMGECEWCSSLSHAGQAECNNAFLEQPFGSPTEKASQKGHAILRRCRWKGGSCKMDEEHIDCGEGAGFLAPPAPPPPMICDELPKLENLSERDPPQECIFYKNDEAACAKAFLETPNGVIRCAWNGHSCRMHYGVGGELCQAQKIEAELRAAVGDERAAEAALAAKAHALEEELLREEKELNATRARASAAASGSTFGAAFSVVVMLLSLGLVGGLIVLQRKGMLKGVAQQLKSTAMPPPGGRRASSRKRHVMRMLDEEEADDDSGRNGYDERTNAAYDDAERGEPEGMPFENVELESPHGSPEAARARSDVGSRRGPPRGGSGGGGKGRGARGAKPKTGVFAANLDRGNSGNSRPSKLGLEL